VFEIIWVVIAGLVIGSIAKLLIPGRQTIPLWATILVGIAGALIGNFLSTVLGSVTPSGSTGSGTPCRWSPRPC
jgi:uncharacterized membrane protein YeaQ/YmgE (transglycosylase-associated protein family)